MAFTATLPQTPQQLLQMESFWNLIQASDETIQYGLYSMLEKKYSTMEKNAENRHKSSSRSFRQMKGILKPLDMTNEQLRDEYLAKKYSL